jgi:Tfp pilus assembly protein PilV
MKTRSQWLARRGSLLVELAMAGVLLTIAMTLTVKVLATVATERRASERRQKALFELANLMERITAYPFEQVTPELAKQMTLSPSARQSLAGSDLAVDVAAGEPGPGRSAKRIALKLRWRVPGGEWSAPVRLTSWIERRRQGS